MASGPSRMTPAAAQSWKPAHVAAFPGLRVLTWSGETLYASRGYDLLRANIRPGSTAIEWTHTAHYHPAWWRNLSSSTRLTARLLRDGLHALAVLSTGDLVGAVPGAIIRLAAGETQFRRVFRILRGTRPLHIAVGTSDLIVWGEYFDNPARDEVHIYASSDCGVTWDVAYTFPKSAVRHIHNIVHDEWANCFWVLTGDNGPECRILRATCDFKQVEVVLSGNQQARAVAAIPMDDALYFSSDTPLERNFVYRLDRCGELGRVAELSASSIYGCRVGQAMFFSTMVEPSRVNRDRHVRVYGSLDGLDWKDLMQWQKDAWPMSFFQYGNALLPDGKNLSGLLAVTTIAVKGGDLETSFWRV